MTAPASVSVVAVTYSPGKHLDRFLDSLADAGVPGVEVVLADNGSIDGSVERAARRPGVRLVHTGGNVGYGRAANVGVAQTSTEFVVVANPDIEWGAGSLSNLLAA
ncbi:MAG: glycosyltransferase family 2 protein, partial [Actinobacteria bacterium]|nr:glycosyltransferase family 2 protein [Actinomycetota bacterium]